MNSHDEKYLRMSLNERVQHVFLFTSFMTLIITGFWLKFPEAWWVVWLKAIIGQNAYSARGTVHRTASVIMILASVYHVFYISFTVRGRQLVKDFWFKKQDAFDFLHSVLYLAGTQKEKPKFGRFSYIEKMEYWAVVWGTVIMGATGGVLWFENTFMNVIRPEGMYVATTIHYYEAILASLAILVWHFYFVFFNPDIKGMNKAWLTGYLTKEEMEEEHPLELEEIENKKKPKEEPAEKTGQKSAEKTDVIVTNAAEKPGAEKLPEAVNAETENVHTNGSNKEEVNGKKTTQEKNNQQK